MGICVTELSKIVLREEMYIVKQIKIERVIIFLTFRKRRLLPIGQRAFCLHSCVKEMST